MKGRSEERVRRERERRLRNLLISDTASTDQGLTIFTWSTAPAGRKMDVMGPLAWQPAGH